MAWTRKPTDTIRPVVGDEIGVGAFPDQFHTTPAAVPGC